MLRLGELKVEMQVLKDDLKDFVWPYQSVSVSCPWVQLVEAWAWFGPCDAL